MPLAAAGCARVFSDTASGALDERPPTVTVTARRLETRVPLLCQRFNAIVDHHLEPGRQHVVFTDAAWHVDLLIVDEADRLKRPPSSSCATSSTAAPSA